MKTLKLLFLSLLLVLSACSSASSSASAEPVTPTAIIPIEITVKDYGTMKAELYPEIAPETVENFVNLARSGFYDGNRFHRIINGFMIQGGADLSGTVANIPGEFAANGFENDLKHTTGVLSMARANDPDSASSQFFIMVGDADWLDGQYAAFGKVTEGIEIALKIAEDARPLDNNGTIAEEAMPIIESIKVLD